jgi:copper homeostasis protein
MGVGYDDLLATASGDPRVAALLMPGGGLEAEHVPWLTRAGVSMFHLDTQVRPGASYKSYVDAGHVRSWRLLVDSAVGRAAASAGGSAVGSAG